MSVFFYACNIVGTEKEESYYDLPGYFRSEIQALKSSNPRVIKVVSLDGKSESLNDDSLDWEKELRPFSDADLNKPVYQKKFMVDTIYDDMDTAAYSVVYSAKDPGMLLQYVMIEFKKNKISEVSIKTYTRNNIYVSTSSLNYKPNDNFSVEMEEDVQPGRTKKFASYTRLLK